MRIGRFGYLLSQAPIVVTASWLYMTLPPGPIESPRVIVLILIVAAFSWFLTILRCHDYNESAWTNFWIDKTPIIGSIWAAAELFVKPGTPGHNSYGAPPLL
jgi:uncharacterized membrane protein YhaH (DUF805 family)